MDDFEVVFAPDFPGEPEFAPESGGIFGKETEEAAGLVRNPVAVDMDALEDLIGGVVAAHFWADNGHFVAGIPKGAGLLPDTAIQREREIFDND
jgi:hypothetical protein